MLTLALYSSGSFSSYKDAVKADAVYETDVTDLDGGTESLSFGGLRTAIDVAAIALQVAGFTNVRAVLLSDDQVVDAADVN